MEIVVGFARASRRILLGAGSGTAAVGRRLARRFRAALGRLRGLDGKIRVDVTVDATSHNLFPFELLIGTSGALLYLCCLALLRRLAEGRAE